ncbi:MAG: DUF3000 family protein [Candidatus Nanopelagicales bacterium]
MNDAADAFAAAVAAVSQVDVRPEIEVSEAPAPSRLAPYAYALTAEIGTDPEIGSGRFVLLHDPGRPAAWDSDTRLVVYVEADIDPEMAQDQLLTDVGWTWLQECLVASEVPFAALGGTVTAVRSTSFESLSARGQETSIQIRGSWSPATLDDLPAHYAAWIALMELSAGLPPYYPGVTQIGEMS